MKSFFKTRSKLFYLLSSALVILFVTVTLISCNKTEEQVSPAPTPASPGTSEEFKGFALKNTIPLSSKDPLISSLRQEKDIVNFNSSLGTLDWNSASLATYEGVDLKAVLVPISKSRTLIAYTDKGIEGFKIMILEISADPTKMKESDGFDKFSGNINLLLTSGATLRESSFTDGNMISNKGMDLATMRTNENWSCFGRCLNNAWDRLPWYLRVACGAGLGACVFGGQPYACAVIAGCMGGYAAGCLWVCR